MPFRLRDNRNAGRKELGSFSKCGRKWNAVGSRMLVGYFGAFDKLRSIVRVSGLRASNSGPLIVMFVPSLFGDGKLMNCDKMATSSCRARYNDSKYCKRTWNSAARCDSDGSAPGSVMDWLKEWSNSNQNDVNTGVRARTNQIAHYLVP